MLRLLCTAALVVLLAGCSSGGDDWWRPRGGRPGRRLNVTAVDWAGASLRGESLGASSTCDAASFTADRRAAAVRAGAAAVLTGLTGIVVRLR